MKHTNLWPTIPNLPATLDRARAACRDYDGELWFPLAESKPAPMAVAICGDCPIRPACLTYALDTGQEYGVWGGLTAPHRKAIQDRRRQDATPANPHRCPNCGTSRPCTDPDICDEARMKRMLDE